MSYKVNNSDGQTTTPVKQPVFDIKIGLHEMEATTALTQDMTPEQRKNAIAKNWVLQITELMKKAPLLEKDKNQVGTVLKSNKEAWEALKKQTIESFRTADFYKIPFAELEKTLESKIAEISEKKFYSGKDKGDIRTTEFGIGSLSSKTPILAATSTMYEYPERTATERAKEDCNDLQNKFRNFMQQIVVEARSAYINEDH